MCIRDSLRIVPGAIQDEPIGAGDVAGQPRIRTICGEWIHLEKVARGSQPGQQVVEERVVGKGPAQIARADEKPLTGSRVCLLYTSDAADERSSVDLGGRRIIKKKKKR